MERTIFDTGKIAILTKYHGPTTFRGSRISATGNGHRVTVSYDCTSASWEAHAKAAKALCEKMSWNGNLLGGTVEGLGMVWVFTD